MTFLLPPRWGLAVGVLLLSYCAIALAGVANKSTAYDEILHLTGGCAYWQYDDYRLHPENGNLPQRWCAIPIVLTNCARLPPPDDPHWRNSQVYELGKTFFYDLGNPLERMLLLGRASCVLFGVGVALLVFGWSRALWGPGGGLVSLAACVLCPTMLAHGPMLTSDMCASFFFLASVTAVWAVFHRIDATRLLLCALCLSGLFLSKVSAGIILVPVFVLVLVRLAAGPPLTVAFGGRTRAVVMPGRKLLAITASAAACTAGIVAIVWLAYGMRYSAFHSPPLPAGEFYRFGSLRDMEERVPASSMNLLTALDSRHLLPQAFLYGAGFVLANRYRPAFFLGDYSLGGWVGYFPYCFLVKTPWPFFALLALAGLGLWRFGRGTGPAVPGDGLRDGSPPLPLWYRAAPLWTLWGAYWAAALVTTINIGHRHLLPTYPPLYVLAGASILWWNHGSRLARFLPLAVLAWSAADTAFAFPNYLAYFNPLLPADRAHEALVDSNLDWGQDLPGLRDWLARRRAAAGTSEVYLQYFGMGRPAYYGIESRPMLPTPDDEMPFTWKPGVYCVSATHLHAVYTPQARRWTPTLEQTYGQTRSVVRQLLAGQELPPALGLSDGPKRKRLFRDFAIMSYIRLLSYLRHRRPDANVGHSILIYELGAADLDEALNGRPVELLPDLPPSPRPPDNSRG